MTVVLFAVEIILKLTVQEFAGDQTYWIQVTIVAGIFK
jgi:hypothetical protein